MKINMGTPTSPEGIPHWSTKELIGRRITSALQSTAAAHYGSPTNRDRMTYAKVSPSQALQWSVTWPYWYVWFYEQPHDGCEGGITVVDLVREAGKNGEVRVESDWLDFRPDIGIYRGACLIKLFHLTCTMRDSLDSGVRRNDVIEIWRQVRHLVERRNTEH